MFYTSAHIQECKGRKNRWRGVLKYKDPSTGVWKERKRTFPGIELKREALVELGRWRAEMEAEAVEREMTGPLRDLTVRQAVSEHLDNQYALHQISIATFQNMRRINQAIIAPRIGRMPFLEVTRNDVQDFVNELARTHAPSSVRMYFAVLSKTYKGALKSEMIVRDPTSGVSLPRLAQNQINYLDACGRHAFLSAISTESRFYLASMIAYYTGMRAGEVCALQWRDVKLPQGVVCVRQTAVFREGAGGGDVVLTVPKTPKSRRVIPLADQLSNILKCEMASRDPKPADFVIEQRNPKLLCAGFMKWARRNGVYGTTGKAISMHGLRHTFATLSVQSGMDVKSLSSILGHTHAAMTLDTYASDDEAAKRVAINTLSDFMRTDIAEA